MPSKTSALLDEVRKAFQGIRLSPGLKDALDRRLSIAVLFAIAIVAALRFALSARTAR